MSILHDFEQFLASKSVLMDRELIDMTGFREKFNFQTPIRIKMSHTDSCYSNIAAAILLNFCKNAFYKTFPWHGLQSVRRIVEKDYREDDCAKMQLELLLHISKMNIHAILSASLIGYFEQMVYRNPTEDWEQAFIDLAKSTVANKNIQKIINDLITEVFGIDTVRHKRKVDVKLVDTQETRLRGFSGVDCVYINFCYFDGKRHSQKKFSDCDVLISIDIITLVLHEYAHVRVRQIVDDINMSTPVKVPQPSSTADLEFGRHTERRFFGAAPDWIRSTILSRGTENGKQILAFAECFIEAVRTSKELPQIPFGMQLNDRYGAVTMGGADIETQCDIE